MQEDLKAFRTPNKQLWRERMYFPNTFKVQVWVREDSINMLKAC